jgi:Peptidase family C25
VPIKTTTDNIMRELSKYAQSYFLGLLACLILMALTLIPGSRSEAAILEVKILSADVLTLDNNTPDRGPNRYQVHARVCNIDSSGPATNVQAKFIFMSEDENCAASTSYWAANCPNSKDECCDDWMPTGYLHLVNPDDTSAVYPDEVETLPKSHGTTVVLDPYPLTGTTDFFDSQDVEDLVAGGDPHIIPDYCHDFLFSTYLDIDSDAVNHAPRTKRTYRVETWADEATTPVTNIDTEGIYRKLNARQSSLSQNMTVALISSPTGPLAVGTTYDFVLEGKMNGQHQAIWGLELDSHIFELVSITSTFTEANPTNPKALLQHKVPFHNNTHFWDFCRWNYDSSDTTADDNGTYGHCYDFTLDNGFYVTGTKEGDFTTASTPPNVTTTYKVKYIKNEITTMIPWVLGESDGSADVTVNWGTAITYTPTYANITNFKAEEVAGDTVVQWTTDAEVGTIGFNLLRKDHGSKAFIQLNQHLLPAEPTVNDGATYSFVDQTAQVGESYIYKIAEIDARGYNNNYGPYPVTIGTASETVKGPENGFQRKAKSLSKKSKALNHSVLETSKIAKDLKEKRRHSYAAKLFVKDAGMYVLDQGEIANLLGFSPRKVTKLIKSNHLQLTNRGQMIPLLAADNGENVLFYGTGIDSLYSEENVYWLSKGRGTLLESASTLNKRVREGEMDASFFRKTVAEENLIYATFLYQDPNADIWNWTWLSGSQAGSNKTFPIHVNALAPGGGEANLEVVLKGASDSDAPHEHHAVIALNGTQVGEIIWSNLDLEITNLVVDAALLHEGENTITVTAILDDGVPYSVIFIDRFELTYPSLYRAVDDVLEFSGHGNPVVTVRGFSTADITVLDITDGTNPKPVPVRISDSVDGSFAVTMMPSTPDQRYYAFTAGAARTATAYPDMRSRLKNARGAEYLIIAPGELLTATKDLARLRENTGMSTMLIDLEDIMDEFNQGIYSPLAIRDFLKYAVTTWRETPEYVLLAGSASFDYKDYLGIGDNLMPTLAATTPFGLNGSDNIYGDIIGDDGIPEIAIGRVPAQTAAELTAYINKIAAYENIAGGQWSKHVLMLADNQDSAGNFQGDSDDLAALLSEDYTVDKIYLPETVIGEAHQTTIDRINNGVGTVNYIGHGGPNWLAGEGMLTSADMANLNNSPMLPIMNFMTCSAGVFEWSGYRSLAEELVLDADGGAAAVWTASGLSLNHLAKKLDKEYFFSAFQQEATTVGKAILKAKAAYGANGNDRYMLDIYNLMGDPALPIQ